MDHPILGSIKLNQLALHEQRVKYAYSLAQKRRQKLAKYLTEEDVKQFQTNGFILKENYLSETDFLALQQELLHHKLPTRETLQGDTATRWMALDHHNLSQLLVIQKLVQSTDWQSLINYVGSFKLQPLYYIQVIMSHVRQARTDP